MSASKGEVLPPLTTKQAQRLAKKKVGQFSFTASQIKRLDRLEEGEKKRQEAQDRAKKSKENKRKRDEKEEKERAAKRQLIDEGKLPREAAWGKVTASQPRLNLFFRQNATRQPDLSQTIKEEEEEGEEEKPLLPGESHKVNVISGDGQKTEPANSEHRDNIKDTEQFSESELSLFFSSLPSSPILSPLKSTYYSCDRLPRNAKRTTSQELSTMATVEQSGHHKDDDGGTTLQAQLVSIVENDAAINHKRPRPKSVTAEEGLCAGTVSQFSITSLKRKVDDDHQFISPTKSIRSALSELSPSKVNIRAQEKPDPTTNEKHDGYSSSPQHAHNASKNEAEEILAMLSTQDLAEDDEIWADKENQVPGSTPSLPSQKDQLQKRNGVAEQNLPTDDPQSLTHFTENMTSFFDENDEEDILAGFDVDQAYEGDYDDGLDDAVLATLACTQKPRKETLVDSGHCSQAEMDEKCKNQMKSAADLVHQMVTPVAPQTALFGEIKQPHSTVDQPSTSTPEVLKKSGRLRKKSSSFLFEGVDDDEFLELVENVDPGMTDGKPTYISQQQQRRKRTLPWIVDPVPPPSTQDLLMESFNTTSTLRIPSDTQTTERL